MKMKQYLFLNETNINMYDESDSSLIPAAVRQKCLYAASSLDGFIDFYKDNISTSWGSLLIFLGTCKMSMKCQK